jgi:hypothetical protein
MGLGVLQCKARWDTRRLPAHRPNAGNFTSSLAQLAIAFLPSCLNQCFYTKTSSCCSSRKRLMGVVSSRLYSCKSGNAIIIIYFLTGYGHPPVISKDQEQKGKRSSLLSTLFLDGAILHDVGAYFRTYHWQSDQFFRMTRILLLPS